MPSIKKQACPTCHQSANVREFTLFSGMVEALWEVCKWAGNKGVDRFSRKDINHILDQYRHVPARFGDWIYFGNILDRDGKKGYYRIDIEKARKFFGGKETIAIKVLHDPLWKLNGTMEYKEVTFGTIDDIGHLNEFLDENKEYIAKYRNRV